MLEWRTVTPKLINRFSLHLGIVEWFNLYAEYVILEVDKFSIGYTLNFVSQLCGYDFLSL